MRDVYFGPEEERLNGVLISAGRVGAPAAVICHPHPRFGGSMNNNVVLGVEAVLSDADFTTLRFDFRGVGRSRGTYGDGTGEREDVLRAVEFLKSDSTTGVVFVVGYSFGAMVSLRAAAADARIEAHGAGFFTKARVTSPRPMPNLLMAALLSITWVSIRYIQSSNCTS